MQGPPGVEMVAAVGSTGRGTLWRASRRQPDDRIVRIVEPRFADGVFRQAVAALARRQPAGMVAIIGHDWTPDGCYYLEYATGDAWLTLAERLAGLADWQDRVVLLERVCSLFSRWQRSPVHPLGLSLHDIVVVAEDDRWLPWLLPCPEITPATPCDLFGVDTPAVAALAPEIVRGLRPDHRAVDCYALGTVVAQALCDDDVPSSVAAEDQVEAQARGMLWPALRSRTRIPSALAAVQEGEDLFRAVEHYRHAVPSARPADAEELRSALAALADPVSIATRLRDTDPLLALDVLRWVREDGGAAHVRAGLLGAEIAAGRGDDETALRHLNGVVRSAPYRFDLRRRRYEAAWRVFAARPADRALGEVLLDDITLLKQTNPEDDDSALHQRAAEVHLLLGDPGAAARELFTVLARDPGDLDALVAYCRCWLELGDVQNARRTGAEARRRIERMVDTQLLTSGEAQQWYERFARLLS
ncbi:tetratricopeptide repeat protein [Lentzea chajnantorensis]